MIWNLKIQDLNYKVISMTDKEAKNQEMCIWHEKKDVGRQFKQMLEIMQVYCKLPKSATKFILDLQLYPVQEDREPTAPRIWLTSNDSSMGIHLMLYSVDLENEYGKVSNEDAFEIFSEYMKYYSQHSEDFTYDNYDGSFQYSIDIQFEVSNRSR